MIEEAKRTIEERMCAAALALGHTIEKDQRNEHFGYDYTSAAAVNQAVGAALSAEGIAVTVAFEIHPLSTFAQVWVNARVSYHSGREMLTSEGLGAGKQVKGDEKALLKAQSVAVKYAHVHAMKLGMGMDPEADDDKEARARPNHPRHQQERKQEPQGQQQSGDAKNWTYGRLQWDADVKDGERGPYLIAKLDDGERVVAVFVSDWEGPPPKQHTECKAYGKVVEGKEYQGRKQWKMSVYAEDFAVKPAEDKSANDGRQQGGRQLTKDQIDADYMAGGQTGPGFDKGDPGPEEFSDDIPF